MPAKNKLRVYEPCKVKTETAICQRTHSTAVNEINVERPLRHIYELGAWLVTWGCRRLANAAKRNAIGSVFC